MNNEADHQIVFLSLNRLCINKTRIDQRIKVSEGGNPLQQHALSVEEKSFDILLNPIRASVSLTLKVLGVTDPKDNPGARGVSAKHQNVRAALVEDYRLQTGQGPSVTPGDKPGLGSIATVSGVPRKKRTSGRN